MTILTLRTLQPWGVGGLDERHLLLLGLIKAQARHGYELTDFIERNLCRVTDMKKATAYFLLDRLASTGLVSVRQEQEGNRPPRRVFSITAAGEAAFGRLLVETLGRAEAMASPVDIALMFCQHLPPGPTLDALEQRLAGVRARLAETQQARASHLAVESVRLALEHIAVHLQAEEAWLAGLLAERRAAAPRA